MKDSLPPLKQALVQHLRADTTLKSAISGIYEGEAPRGAKMPFILFSFVPSPIDYLWGSALQRIVFDIFAIAENGVDASNVDALVFSRLHDAPLSLSEQSTLICRRVMSVQMPPYLSEEGKRIHQVGGSYEVWTDQPL